MNRFSLTFKNNEKEKKIYEFIKGQFSPGNYIKELVWQDMNKSQIKTNYETEMEKQVKEDPADNFDFGDFGKEE